MNKYVFIDSRIRDFELEKLRSLGYKVILLKKQNHVYPEISAHADIFMIRINNFLFIEEKMYASLLKDILFNEFFFFIKFVLLCPFIKIAQRNFIKTIFKKTL